MTEPLDLAGIGVGPFNLSVAALADGRGLAARFFEAKPTFDWHPGLMLPDACLQTSFLKDLVTPVEPTSPHGFLAYLVAKGRFYAFMNAAQDVVTRQEFSDYLAWVASRLDSLVFGTRVREIDFERDRFVVRTDRGSVAARNVCVGVGKRPHVPACCRGLPAASCFHGIAMENEPRALAGRRVTVVGGGQTGAEIVLNLLSERWGRPAQVRWLSRRPNFLPLDDSPFVNEWFTPAYVDSFRRLPERRRNRTVASQKLASDGISLATLQALYRTLYRIVHVEGDPGRVELLPARELVEVARSGHYRLAAINTHDGEREFFDTDVLVLCTGFESGLPDCLAPLAERIELETSGDPALNEAFAAAWDGPRDNRLYLLNAGRHSHGIAEPQLSLMAWRSARVLNDLLGRACFNVEAGGGLLSWHAGYASRAVA